MTNISKIIFTALGGFLGWFVAEFKPTFPLLIIAIIFILYDARTAYLLDKRVHQKYPDRTARKRVHFTSFLFGKVVRETIPTRLWLIFLAFLAEHWVFIHVTIPASYVVTGVVCAEQFWSILENNASCRDANESRFWKLMQKVFIDKSERHFDVDLSELRKEQDDEDNLQHTDTSEGL